MWRFVQWYNTEHRHSGLKSVTPQQRHCNEAPAIMRRRVVVYEQRERCQLTATLEQRDGLVTAIERVAQSHENGLA